MEYINKNNKEELQECEWENTSWEEQSGMAVSVRSNLL